MTTLFVNACAWEHSRTHALCDEYLNDIDQVETVNLFDLDLKPLNWTRLTEREELQRDEDWGDSMFDLAKQFAAADEIVIGAPYWDISFPAILKVYIELVTVNGITFHYTEEGMPEGLCRAKRLIYISTAGGPSSKANFGYEYLAGIARLYGIPETHQIAAEMLDVVGMDVDAIMNEAKDAIHQLKASLPSL